MTVYNLVLFFHILAMLGLMVAVTFHWSMLHNAKWANDGRQAARWIRATERLPLLVFSSLLVILASGVYMAAHIKAFGRGWISASFLAILLIGAVSIAGGPATRALQRYARQGGGHEIQRTLSRPLLVLPVRLQLALLLTITFLMVVRTNWATSLQIISFGSIFGILWSITTWRTGRF